MAELRFYLDENVHLEVFHQLVVSGIDAVSAHGLDRLGAEDVDHLRHATELGRVLCTHDQDFLRLAAGIPHAGIAFLPQARGGVLHARLNAKAASGRVFFLPLR